MTAKHWYAMKLADVQHAFESRAGGLSAKDVAELRLSTGWNELPREPLAPWWVFLFGQFKSPLMVVLILAAVISLVLGDKVDASVIALAAGLNALVGFLQEYKANRALEQLRSFVQPSCIVRRDGREQSIPARDVLPGDVLVLSAGDRVAADARVQHETDLEANESALTGESMPVRKFVKELPPGTALADRSNMLHAGTVIAAGRAEALVVATGIHTELGTIAQLVQSTKESATPLQTELRKLAIWISFVVLTIVVSLFVLGIVAGRDWFDMFETSVALAVAAIPEGLTVSVTIILAIGMQRILKRKALTRRLLAAETLGSVSVICTDKTGTITQGQMRVSEIALESGVVNLAELEYGSAAKDVLHVLEAGMLCNDAAVNVGDGLADVEVFGTPTEKALMEAGLQAGIQYNELEKAHPRVAEVPFDSAKKWMLTAHKRGAHVEVIVKGAPEKVFGFCTGGEAQKRAWKEIVDEMTERGLRVVALAQKKETGKSSVDLKPSGFSLLGFVGLRDPLRPEAKEQIRAAAQAGVRTVLITGDHPKTALAIAREVGLADKKDEVVVGVMLDAWDDEELRKRVEGIRVYARVEPRHKIRIIHAWQSRGEVVAMTGDGVNDAPALKAADVGVALGSGVEVAKEVGDLVLLDNNLSTITSAIEQGRVMFDNIRKSVVYLMTSCFTEIVLIGAAILFGMPLPLLPAQILWINLVADTFPNLGLTLEPGEPDIMKSPPRKRDEPVLNRRMLVLLILIGLVTDATLFGIYAWLLQSHVDLAYAQSLLFAAVGIDSMIFVFAIKSFRRSIFRVNPFSNPSLVAGVAAGMLLMVAAFAIPPLRQVLGVTQIPLSAWEFLLMIGVFKLAVVEIAKETLLKRYV